MIILIIRTDNPVAEVGLYDNGQELGHDKWAAHRELSDTLHKRISELLSGNNRRFSDINGIIVYAGPGSFTGLRIGISVANALSYSLNVPAVGASGENWIQQGIKLLLKSGNRKAKSVVPVYGAPVYITKPNK